MHLAGYVLVGIIGLYTGILIEEVSLPGVGTMTKEGPQISASIKETTYLADGEKLTVLPPGVGFLMKNAEGRIDVALEGTLIASRSKDSMDFSVATQAKDVDHSRGGIRSLGDFVFPSKRFFEPSTPQALVTWQLVAPRLWEALGNAGEL